MYFAENAADGFLDKVLSYAVKLRGHKHRVNESPPINPPLRYTFHSALRMSLQFAGLDHFALSSSAADPGLLASSMGFSAGSVWEGTTLP